MWTDDIAPRTFPWKGATKGEELQETLRDVFSKLGISIGLLNFLIVNDVLGP